MKQMVVKLNDGRTNGFLTRQLAANEFSPGMLQSLWKAK